MNGTKTARRWTAALAAALGLMSLGTLGAWAADPVASNNSGSFQVRITPNVDLGVLVDTAGAAWAGDTDLYTDLEPGQEKLLGTGVKLSVAGNFNKQEFELSAVKVDTWDLDSDEAASADLMRLYALIGTFQNTSPATGLFGGTDHLIRTDLAKLAGQAQADEATADALPKTFEMLTTAGALYADVDDMTTVPATDRTLWLRMNGPSATTVDAEQKFTITVTARSGAGQ